MAGLNWPGLFAWSTKYHDGTAPSQFSKMTDEDRAFLEKAMEEAFGKVEDPNKVLQECVEKFKAEDRTDESLSTTLEVVDRLCDDPDIARNVEKIGCLQPILDLAEGTTNESIRARTLEILALLFSNNLKIQEAGVRRGAMAIFLRQTREAPVGSDERSKAFRALVALVRGAPEAEDIFLRKEGGFELLVQLLDETEEPRTREKVAAFIRSMACNGTALKEAEEITPLLEALVPLLSTTGEQGIQYRETLSQCIAELARVTGASKAPAPLAPALRERLEKLGAAANEGEESAQEASALQDALSALEA